MLTSVFHAGAVVQLNKWQCDAKRPRVSVAQHACLRAGKPRTSPETNLKERKRKKEAKMAQQALLGPV